MALDKPHLTRGMGTVEKYMQKKRLLKQMYNII